MTPAGPEHPPDERRSFADLITMLTTALQPPPTDAGRRAD